MIKKTALIGMLCACLGAAACGDNEEIDVSEPAPTPPPPAGSAMVPEMKPTGDFAPSFGTAPVGSDGAAPTGSAVPEMTPTGNMKQAVVPGQPSQPAPPPK